jgi:hypothetical protein
MTVIWAAGHVLSYKLTGDSEVFTTSIIRVRLSSSYSQLLKPEISLLLKLVSYPKGIKCIEGV